MFLTIAEGEIASNSAVVCINAGIILVMILVNPSFADIPENIALAASKFLMPSVTMAVLDTKLPLVSFGLSVITPAIYIEPILE